MDREELLQQVEAWETKSASKEEFDAAAERAKPLTDLSNDQKLVLYGLFKQATVGDVNTSRPWGIDMVGCAKWDAWKSYQGISQEKASLCYIYYVDVVLIKSSKGSSNFGAPVSTMKNCYSDVVWSDNERVFNLIVENDVLGFSRHILEHPNDISAQNEENQSPLHFACDRGNIEIVDILVQNGAEIDKVDSFNETPLMCAAVSGHKNIVEFLLSKGADVDVENIDGETVLTSSVVDPGVRALVKKLKAQ